MTMKANNSSASTNNNNNKAKSYIPINYKKISKSKVGSVDFTLRGDPDMDFASQILYNAMAATMAPIFCIELNLYRKEINGQGPCLLHYVFM